MRKQAQALFLLAILTLAGCMTPTQDTAEPGASAHGTTTTPTANGTQAPASSPNTTTPTEPAAPRELPVYEVVVELTGHYSRTASQNTVAYTLDPIRVPANHHIVLTWRNTDEADFKHDFVIDEFGVETRSLAPGEEQTVEFDVGDPTMVKYHCSVGMGSHRRNGMEGDFIVE